MKRCALLFDLDGTLIDSLLDLRAGLNQMLREMGRRELTPKEVRLMIGDGSRALVGRALSATGAAIDAEGPYGRFMQIYQAGLAHLSRLYPDVEETLRMLRDEGARLAICTNKPQSATLALLQHLGIAQHFEVVLCGDIVPFRKPDARHLLMALDQLRAQPNESAMIGDNENDYAAARGAGLPVILMRYGYLRVPPETLTPDVWLDRFSDLPNALGSLIARD
jgi:phosphoglycolate phosphatase